MTAKAASKRSRERPSNIIKEAESFSSFSVKDLDEAKNFYSETLGLDVSKTPEGL
jgi:hypothetical protein